MIERKKKPKLKDQGISTSTGEEPVITPFYLPASVASPGGVSDSSLTALGKASRDHEFQLYHPELKSTNETGGS